MSRDGQTQQVTHFLDIFSDANINYGYSLSPDNKYVAFWMKARPSNTSDPQLMILELDTGMVTSFCLTGISFLDESTVNLRAPIWSPDSTQLLVLSSDPDDYTRKFVVLVDIINGFAAKIAEGVEAQGWMIAP